MKVFRNILPAIPLIVLAIVLLAIFVSPGIRSAQFAECYEKPFLVFVTGLVTIASSYVAAVVQSSLRREQERIRARRERVRTYQDYLDNLLSACQRYDILLNKYPELNRLLPREHQITREDKKPKMLYDVILQMPPLWELSSISDEDARRAVDRAVDYALRLLSDVYSGRVPDYYKDVRAAYVEALEEIDKFVLNG